MQKRIYRASQSGNFRLVRQLQKLLISSRAAKLLAIRRVTQDNPGKRTPGIDGKTALSERERLEWVNKLKVSGKSQPVRRVYIPKPGKSDKRPLGIPTLQDRALQALVKLVLEPEWEAQFTKDSYGFRPGRSVHDAISAIFQQIAVAKRRIVIDADIHKCFERINHRRLLSVLNNSSKIKQQIKAWLKAGVIDQGSLFPTEAGTPQGGVISPLLSNIALHHALDLRFNGTSGETAKLIRYADDFVLALEPPFQNLEFWISSLNSGLNEWGLELNLDKTRQVTTLAGFDFLGFNIRQYKAKQTQSGLKTLIKPSQAAQKRIYQKVKRVIDQSKNAAQIRLINQLNPILKGWCYYYKTVVAKESFHHLHDKLIRKLMRWAIRRHSHQGKHESLDRYFGTVGASHWTFRCKTSEGNTLQLYNPTKTPIRRPIKVRGNQSPYDGDMSYWAMRMSQSPLLSPTEQTLLKRQKARCSLCHLPLMNEDHWEIDHITPKALGGRNNLENLQLVHKHCHDSKTREDLLEIRTHLKGNDTEEPDEGKLSCPVLKTSSSGDRIA